MKVLGNSLHIANSGKLIARSSKTPSPGGIVFNSDKTKIGKAMFLDLLKVRMFQLNYLNLLI